MANGDLTEAVALAIVHVHDGRAPREGVGDVRRKEALAALGAIPDGWAKVDGEWIRIREVEVETRHDGTFSYYRIETMPEDPYGPDEFAQSFQCHHGTTVATRDEYGCWTGHPCAACQTEAQR